MQIEWVDICQTNYAHTPGQWTGFCLHYTGGPNVQAAINWFKNCDSHVSANYIISKDGKVYQCIDNHKGYAYHVGSALNKTLIGIEMASSGEIPTEAQYKSVTEIIAKDAKEFRIQINRNNIVGHYQLNPINRPTDARSVDYDRVIRETNSILNQTIMLTADDKSQIRISRPDIAKDEAVAGFDMNDWFNRTGYRDYINDKITLDRTVTDLGQSMAKLQAVVNQNQSVVDGLTKELETTKGHVTELSQLQTSTSEQITQLKGQIQTYEIQINTYKNNEDSLYKQLQERDSTITILNQKIKSLDEHLAGTQAVVYSQVSLDKLAQNIKDFFRKIFHPSQGTPVVVDSTPVSVAEVKPVEPVQASNIVVDDP